MPHHLSNVILLVTLVTFSGTAALKGDSGNTHCKNPFSTISSIFYPYYKRPLNCIGSSASKADHPLIPSLFPERLAPSIKFVVASTSSNLRRRRSLFSHLKWVQLVNAPPVPMVISASGLSFVPFGSTDDWFGFLSTGNRRRDPNRSPENVIKTASCKYSQMPNGTTLDHKVEFVRHYRRYQKRFPSWDWHLPAFILPEEKEEFKATFRKNPTETWIYKPSTAARSAGIEVLRGGNATIVESKKCSAVVQKYLEDPFILDDAKVEPRLYLVITSIHPLRIYAYNNSFAKTLLDYELNVWKNGFLNTSNEKTYFRQTFKHFWPRMGRLGFDVEKLMAEMVDITIKSIFLGEQEIYEATKAFPRKTSYQYYNHDFMWRRDMKPYLIEINRFPAYERGHHYKHYRNHLADMLTLVGYQVNVSAPDTKTGMSCDCAEVLKIDLGIELNPEDILDLMEAEDELNRMKGTGFKRLFPSTDMFQYLQYVESDIKPYLVQYAWERAFGDKRREAVCHLRCRAGLEWKV